MKKVSLAMLMLSALVGWAQNNLFEEMKKYDGEFYIGFEIYHNTASGEYRISPSKDTCKISIQKDQHGNGVGVNVSDVLAENFAFKYNLDDDDLDHYTEPAFVRRGKSIYKESFIMVDGFLFSLNETYKDLSGFHFKAVYVPLSLLAEEKSSEEAPSKGIKGLKGKVKDKLSAFTVPAYLDKIKELEATKELIANYAKAMKEKQARNPMTATDKKQFADIEVARQKKKQEIIDYNNAYKRKPEYHRILQNTCNAQAPMDRKEFIRVEGSDAKVDNCQYFIKNESSKTFTYVISTEETGTVAPGVTQEFSCYYITFFAEGENKGKVIWGGGQGSRDKTYIVK